STVWSCFLFVAIAQFVWGGIAVITAALFTRSTWILALVAFLTGFCPPLNDYFYSKSLVSSEIVALVPLGMMFLALSKASILRSNDSGITWLLIWFTSAGVWLGLASLVRDSLNMFAWFTAIFLIMTTRLRSFKQLGVALASGFVLIVATEA